MKITKKQAQRALEITEACHKASYQLKGRFDHDTARWITEHFLFPNGREEEARGDTA